MSRHRITQTKIPRPPPKQDRRALGLSNAIPILEVGHNAFRDWIDINVQRRMATLAAIADYSLR